MSTLSDHATVLRRSDWSETSQIVTLLTGEHGKQRLIAKGIQRSTKTRFACGLDLLDTGQVLFSSRPERGLQLGTLIEWKPTSFFPRLRESLDASYAAQYAAEISDQLTEDGDPHPGLWSALTGLLEALGGRTPTLELVIGYQRALLTAVGLWPELSRCVETGRDLNREDEIYFSSSAGGVICRDAEPALIEKRRVHPATLAGLREGRWTPAALADAFDLLNYHLEQNAGRAMRLAGYVRQASRRPAKS